MASAADKLVEPAGTKHKARLRNRAVVRRAGWIAATSGRARSWNMRISSSRKRSGSRPADKIGRPHLPLTAHPTPAIRQMKWVEQFGQNHFCSPDLSFCPIILLSHPAPFVLPSEPTDF